MISPTIITELPGKLDQLVQGFSLMVPELLILGSIIFAIVMELFLHGKSAKTGTSWRYFSTQLVLFLAVALAFQRMTNQLQGYASFHFFLVNAGSNAINLLLIAFGLLILVVSQIQSKHYTLEEQIGFLSILAGSLLAGISNHWLSIFLSIELMSLGTYLLVAIRKDVEGARASLPYVLFGLGSSAIFLYGISLIYGLSGTLFVNSPAFSRALSTADPMLVGLSLSLLSIALLFKMSWAPLHPWSPDVIETLPASWMSWISIAPKIAVTWVGIRILHFIPFSLASYISILAILTLIIGNLGALRQTNTKRLLAYSSIAHGGFMAIVWLFPAKEATQSLLFYGITYGLSTILVFFMTESKDGKYQKDDMGRWHQYANSNPMNALLILIGFIALIGLPPAGTFLAKITYFSLLWEKYQLAHQSTILFLLVTAVLTTAISLFYYLKIPFYMYLKKSQPDQIADQMASQNTLVWAIIAAGIIFCFLAPNMVLNFWKI